MHTMDKTEFLEKNIFLNLKNANDGFDTESVHYFSESDFQIVLERIEKLGIGIFEIKPWIDGAFLDVKVHDEYRKKATDPAWYKKSFAQFKKQQENLLYSATFKISDKLLHRKHIVEEGEEELSLIERIDKKVADAELKKEKKKAEQLKKDSESNKEENINR